jgi:DNA-directed RNA polymerase specialized sigma24 family protein
MRGERSGLREPETGVHETPLLEERELRALRTALLFIATDFGPGAWRVPADAVDKCYDILIDRLLARKPEGDGWTLRDPRTFASAVLRNLIRSGPERAELDRHRVSALSDDAEVLEPREEGNPPSLPGTSGSLRAAIPAAALAALTENERRAVLSTPGVPRMADAAAIAGMTGRDLRVRLRRAAVKIRKILPLLKQV